MTLLLDTEDDFFIAEDAADMARQLITLLEVSPDEDTLVWLAATVLGCDVLDVIITQTK
ncbi:hypothetical protein [Corynebacterium alimapuense]|uniref:hypothetical protein n=1 Tax=Corynebacterium alimapuense TaxID=1576874 RepID=UPI001403978C|nr:hypothetical protein [Corynebacterium alimapuense]